MSVVPPGLTCPRCHLALRGGLSRRTPEGYVHAEPCVSPRDLTTLPGRWVSRGGVARWVA